MPSKSFRRPGASARTDFLVFPTQEPYGDMKAGLRRKLAKSTVVVSLMRAPRRNERPEAVKKRANERKADLCKRLASLAPGRHPADKQIVRKCSESGRSFRNKNEVRRFLEGQIGGVTRTELEIRVRVLAGAKKIRLSP